MSWYVGWNGIHNGIARRIYYKYWRKRKYSMNKTLIMKEDARVKEEFLTSRYNNERQIEGSFEESNGQFCTVDY